MANDLSIKETTALLEKLDEFNSNVEKYLFDQISDHTYLDTLDANPELAVRLQELLDEEVKLRLKILQMKSLLEMKKEIEQLASDENVRARARQAQEERLKAGIAILDGK